MAVSSAYASAASLPLTSSSGATATITAGPGQTIYLQKIIVLMGPSAITLHNDLTLTGLAIGPLILPFSQLASEADQIEIDLTAIYTPGAPASAPGQSVSLTIPPLLGGAEATLILIGVLL
jgi:hypothetical protein